MLFNGNRFRYTASEGMGRQESPQLIERKTQVDTDAQETSRASKYFLENVALKSLNYHCIHIDQLELIQPTGIGSTSTCKQLHRRSVPRFRSVRKTEIQKECKTDGSGKSSPRVANSRA